MTTTLTPRPRTGAVPTTTETNGSRGQAVLDGAQVRITHLACTDPDVRAGAERRAQQTGSRDVTDYVATALSVGAKALAVVGTGVDLAAVDRSVQSLTTQVEAATTTALQRLTDAVAAATNDHDGAIPAAVHSALAQMSDTITGLVAGADAPVRTTVTDAVRTVTDGVLAEVQRAIAAQSAAVRTAVAADAPGSPFQTLRSELIAGLNASHHRLAGQLAELRTALEVDKARVEATSQADAKAPTHGLVFEDAVLQALEPITYTAGDTLTPTGTTTGSIPRALIGDAVVDLAPNPTLPGRAARICIQVKDRGRRASAAAWAQELERARTNRNAVAALGILRSPDQMPGTARRLHILSPTEYLIAYDPTAGDDPDLLTAAYLLLRAHTWAAVLEDHGDHDVDLAALRTGLAEGLQALTGFDTLTRHTAGARKQLDDLDKVTLTLRNTLRSRLEATLRLLEPTPREAPTPAAGATA